MIRRHPEVALVLAAAIFGTTFVVVKSGIEDVSVTAFLATRFAIGALAMSPLAARRRAAATRRTLRDGLLVGFILALAYITQTAGLRELDSSTSAFITYLLVVFVPLIVAVEARRLPSRVTAVGVVVSTVGLFLLSGATGAPFGRGTVLTLAGAFLFGLHIVVLGHVSARHDAALLNLTQLAVVSAVCLAPALVQGGFRFSGTRWLGLIYLGIITTAGAFLLQTWAQARVEPTRAMLLLMLEPVFAAVVGHVSGDNLGLRALIGAAAILGGVAVVEFGAKGPESGVTAHS